MPTPPGQPVVDCTIELRGSEPRVWRRLLVPGSVRLDRLHRMFQAAMGWEDCHLHAFEIGGERYGMQIDDYPDGELQEQDVTVVTAIGANERFTYEYDFGDSWDHEITVHSVRRMPTACGSPCAWTEPTRARPKTSEASGATSTCSQCSPTPPTRSTTT